MVRVDIKLEAGGYDTKFLLPGSVKHTEQSVSYVGPGLYKYYHDVVIDDGKLFFDPDGDGTAPRQLIAILTGHPHVAYDDFLII